MEKVKEKLLNEINYIMSTVEDLTEVGRLESAECQLNPTYVLINFGYSGEIIDDDEHFYYIDKANNLFFNIVDKRCSENN